MSSLSVQEHLHQLKQVDLTAEPNKLIREAGKQGRQEAHKNALVALHQAFEQNFVEAVCLALGLNEAQAKKIRYKKDRVRILKAKGIDYLAVDGAETAQVLSQIAQPIRREVANVTHDLHDIFPFWKEGWPMVQFDNAYKILAEDITIHYQMMLDRLLDETA